MIVFFLLLHSSSWCLLLASWQQTFFTQQFKKIWTCSNEMYLIEHLTNSLRGRWALERNNNSNTHHCAKNSWLKQLVLRQREDAKQIFFAWGHDSKCICNRFWFRVANRTTISIFYDKCKGWCHTMHNAASILTLQKALS